jgi:hypothetical protein
MSSEQGGMMDLQTAPDAEQSARARYEHGHTLAVEFPRSFRQAAELVIEARKCVRFVRSGHPDVASQCTQLLDGLNELRARLLSENFYFRALELGIESSPELIRLARTSSDWRVVQFLSLLDTNYPEFAAEYEFVLNLLAANPRALSHVFLDGESAAIAA